MQDIPEADVPAEEPAATPAKTPSTEAPDAFTEIVADLIEDAFAEEPDTVVDDGEPDPTTPEGLARYDAETVRLIGEAKVEARDAEAAYEIAKKASNIAKKAFEHAATRLLDLIEERDEGRGKKPQKNLFSDIGKNDGDGSKDQPPATATIDLPIGSADPWGNLWEMFPIDIEGPWLQWMKKGDIEKLNAGDVKDGPAHPILNMGDMSRYTTPNPANPSFTRRLIDIQGIGKAAAERIEAALVEFWAWWNRGGQAEFAAKMGVTSNATQPADGGEVRGDGEPAADSGPDAVPTADAAPEAPAEAPAGAEEAAEVPKPKGRRRRGDV